MSTFNPWTGGFADAPEGGEIALTRPEPEPAEFADPYTAPTRSAQYACGVRWIADYQTLDDGMCRHARVQARALYDAGLATHLQSMTHMIRIGRAPSTGDALDDALALPPGLYAASADLTDVGVRKLTDPMVNGTISQPDVVVRQAPFASHKEFLAYSLPRYAQADPKMAAGILARTVAYLPWERSTLEPRFAEVLSQCGQVWLQSRRHIKIFEDAGVPAEKLVLIPNTYDVHCHVARLGQSGAAMPKGKRFYHIGKWEPRKNQVKLLGAFFTAFKPTDAASLFIKTQPFGGNWEEYPGPEGALDHWLDHPDVQANGWTRENYSSRVRIVDRTYSEEALAKFHAANNIYVSSGAGEAWDYPAFDSKLAGNRLVYVGFGGPEDYASPDDVRVDWRLGPVHGGYSWGHKAEWAHYEVRDLALALKRAEPHPQRLQSPELLNLVGPKAIGQRMTDALCQLIGVSFEEWLDAGARVVV